MTDQATSLTIVNGARDLGMLGTNIQTFISKNAEPSHYAWAFPTIGSTDDAVAAFLAKPATAFGPEPCNYEAHLAAASGLLDGCLARNDHIRSLEGVALTTALDLLYDEIGQPFDFGLAQVGLKAVRKQAGADDKEAGPDTLKKQFDVRADARDARVALHLQPGSPLNYKERIDTLRALLAEDVRSIRELLAAARLGMHQSGVAPNLEPVPDWKPSPTDKAVLQPNNLMQLVNWCRSAIRSMEINSTKEVIHTEIIPLVKFNLISSANLSKAIGSVYATNNNFTNALTFQLQDGHLGVRKGPHRLLNFGIALKGETLTSASAIFPPPPPPTTDEHERADKLVDWLEASAVVEPPVQSAAFSGPPGAKPVQWVRQELDINGEVCAWRGLSRQRFPSNAARALGNLNPLGTWNIYFKRAYYHPDGGDSTLTDLFSKGLSYRNLSWVPDDIVVFMTLASLQSQ